MFLADLVLSLHVAVIAFNVFGLIAIPLGSWRRWGFVRAPLWRPQKTATAYDAAANSSTEACKALAKDKLKEATGAVVSAVIKS